jgi:predicted RNA-binding protein Jag
MKQLTIINDIKNICFLIKNYYNQKTYKTALEKVIDCLHVIYSDYNDYNSNISILGIKEINIGFNKKTDTYIIRIKLSNIGVLIGEKGSSFNALNELIEKTLQCSVEFIILEEKRF